MTVYTVPNTHFLTDLTGLTFAEKPPFQANPTLSDRLTSWVDFLRTGPSPCTLPLKTEMQREAIAVTGRWSFF